VVVNIEEKLKVIDDLVNRPLYIFLFVREEYIGTLGKNEITI
jgi:hypothetical protein